MISRDVRRMIYLYGLKRCKAHDLFIFSELYYIIVSLNTSLLFTISHETIPITVTLLINFLFRYQYSCTRPVQPCTALCRPVQPCAFLHQTCAALDRPVPTCAALCSPDAYLINYDGIIVSYIQQNELLIFAYIFNMHLTNKSYLL